MSSTSATHQPLLLLFLAAHLVCSSLPAPPMLGLCCCMLPHLAPHGPLLLLVLTVTSKGLVPGWCIQPVFISTIHHSRSNGGRIPPTRCTTSVPAALPVAVLVKQAPASAW